MSANSWASSSTATCIRRPGSRSGFLRARRRSPAASPSSRRAISRSCSRPARSPLPCRFSRSGRSAPRSAPTPSGEAFAVVAFMLIYYRLSGFIADVALALNLLVLLAAMAGFHATLTLPGIAGVVLTIGMAVDTNILIFERIREELRSGKTVRAAIDSGFARAFRTVIDTHVTVLVSAAILYQFGTGPVKGFAVTLAIGIFASLFTAVFFTRLVFDLLYMRGRRVESISI